MVKKHLPTLGELLSTLKKCVQDHKVYPFHRHEELEKTLKKIRYIIGESGHTFLPEHEQELLEEADEIIEEQERIKYRTMFKNFIPDLEKLIKDHDDIFKINTFYTYYYFNLSPEERVVFDKLINFAKVFISTD